MMGRGKQARKRPLLRKKSAADRETKTEEKKKRSNSGQRPSFHSPSFPDGGRRGKKKEKKNWIRKKGNFPPLILWHGKRVRSGFNSSIDER